MTVVTEQLSLAGMPARLFTCTPSKLASYQACPRRYRMTYLDRPALPRGGAWAHTGMGAALHNALRSLYDAPVQRRTPDAAVFLLRRGWPADGFRDDEQRAAMLALACQWIRSYVEELDVTDEPRGVERVVAIRTDRLSLSGRVDRLDQREGELVIVDYKAGRHLLSTDDARGSMAMALYALAASATLRLPCTRVELHHLPSGEVHVWEHTAESLARILARAEDIAADAMRATTSLAEGRDPDVAFPANPSRACTWCDFQRHCEPGTAMGERRAPWDGLPDEVRG